MGNVVPFPGTFNGLARVSTDELKRTWDMLADDPDLDPGCLLVEPIHAELNRRGEGQHCAV